MKNERFCNALFAAVHAAFAALLAREAANPLVWNARLATLKRHGLLAFLMPNPIKAAPIVLDTERLDTDGIYRRRMAKKLLAPRPGKNVTVNVEIERERLLNDEAYIADICKLLAYRFVGNLMPVEDATHRLMLLKIDEAFLKNCLDALGPHQVDGAAIAGRWLREAVEAEVERHPRFIAACNAIREVAAREKAALAVFCAELRAKVKEDFARKTGEILAEANRKADEAIAEMAAARGFAA